MKNEYKIVGEEVHVLIKSRVEETRVMIVDVSDLDALKGLNKSICIKKTKNYDYAVYYERVNGKAKKRLIHRFLMKTPAEMVTDHIDGNGLNNKRSNLRICTPAENNQNAFSRDESRTRGVTWKQNNKKYQARVQLNGKCKHIGLYKNKEDAIKAVVEFRKKHMPFSNEERMKQV